MKYVFSLVAGLVLGAVLVVVALYYNPLVGDNPRVPLAATPGASVEVFYDAAADTIARTGPVDDLLAIVPPAAEELWEPALAGTEVRLLRLRDVDGRPVGLGVRFATLNSGTRPLTGELLVDNVWNLHLQGRGSLFVDGVDNLWPLARQVLVPAWRAEDGVWQGSVDGDITVGPRPTRVAVMTGGAGVFAGTRGEARESLSAEALSLRDKQLTADGSLLIAITGPADAGRINPE